MEYLSIPVAWWHCTGRPQSASPSRWSPCTASRSCPWTTNQRSLLRSRDPPPPIPAHLISFLSLSLLSPQERSSSCTRAGWPSRLATLSWWCSDLCSPLPVFGPLLPIFMGFWIQLRLSLSSQHDTNKLLLSCVLVIIHWTTEDTPYKSKKTLKY